MKTLSIIGIVLSVISLMCIITFNNIFDYEAGLGWGIYACLYLSAFSITSLVKNKHYKK